MKTSLTLFALLLPLPALTWVHAAHADQDSKATPDARVPSDWGVTLGLGAGAASASDSTGTSSGGLLATFDARFWYRFVEGGVLLMGRVGPLNVSTNTAAGVLGVTYRETPHLAIDLLGLLGNRSYQDSYEYDPTQARSPEPLSTSVGCGGMLAGISGWVGDRARFEFGAWLAIDRDFSSSNIAYSYVSRQSGGGGLGGGTATLGGETEYAAFVRLAFSFDGGG
jgi:hypothetical protein